MREAASRIGYVPAGAEGSPGTYPMQRLCLLWGFSGGLVAALLFTSVLAGFAFVVLFVCTGAVWRRDEPPILAFCIALQWVSVTTGYLYERLTGTFPNVPAPPHSERAVFLSLIGLLVIVAGLRAVFRALPRRLEARFPQERRYHVRRLFWLVITLFTANWVVEILPADLAFEAAHLVSNILAFKHLFVGLLVFASVRQRSGYRYVALALAYVFLPSVTSAHAAFVGVPSLLVIAFLAEWRPWSRSRADRVRNARIVAGVAALTISVFSMALLWQGGVKPAWRLALQTGAAEASPIEKIQVLAATIERETAEINWDDAVYSLAQRLGGSFYVSHVLDRVPRVVPHEGGALTLRAVTLTVTPRVLFPDKPSLGSNSWLIWKYAGLPAAGEEEGTSIGLSYMAEFYIDFGIVGMFVALFVWGAIVGMAYAAVAWAAPSRLFFGAAATMLFPQPFASYEGEIAYLLGGLVHATVVLSALLLVVGPGLHRWLSASGAR